MAGRGCAKTIANERTARLKATKQHVYISGLKGHHTLETGVAYHYRGHFIYAFPAGNPIEPVPFSTKKGITISGVVQDQAPLWDHQDSDLVLENTIAALQRSCVHEWEFQQEQEEAKKQETKKALEMEAGDENDTVTGSAKEIDAVVNPKASAQEPLPSQVPSRVPSFTTLLVPSQLSSHIGSRIGSPRSPRSRPVPYDGNSSSLDNIPRLGTVEAPPIPSTVFTPHDRGHYLAYSAPGSRHASVDNTPFVSRPVSPTHFHGLSARGSHDSGHDSLRPIASTSRLNQLLAEEGFRRSLSPLADVSEDHLRDSGQWGERDEDMVAKLSVSQGWMDPDDISVFVDTVSRRPSPSRLSSRSRSRPLSRMSSRSPRGDSGSPEKDGEGGVYLHGLGHPDVIRDDEASRAQTMESSPSRAPGYQSAESAAYLRGLAMRRYDIGNVEPETSSSRSQTPIRQAPTGLFGSPVVATSLHRDATPAFTFPVSQGIPDTSSFPAFDDSVPPVSYTGHIDKKPLVAGRPRAGSKSVHTGRPRAGSKSVHTGRPRAASKALNEAYNAANPSSTPRPVFPFSFVPPVERTGTGTNNTTTETNSTAFIARCPIHSESCNGQDVVHEHIAQRARDSAGFKDLFPTIECEDGRVMVDWKKIMAEEMERLKGM
ncbi:hypothetical protein G6011_11661 [Alternaria panax]|uniref:Uncharacterized protein n=1 Tax=Alternaria panax TaxID=48097 RepID=A0AAD4IDU4_9PLEO|nr:hypothetical protein G6011_11661 [Alternaria panax]